MNEIVKWTSLMVKISCLHVQSLSLDYSMKCVQVTLIVTLIVHGGSTHGGSNSMWCQPIVVPTRCHQPMVVPTHWWYQTSVVPTHGVAY